MPAFIPVLQLFRYALASPSLGLVALAFVAAPQTAATQPPDEHIGPHEICGSCRRDPSSPTGASQFCKFGNTGRRIPCSIDEPERPRDPRPPVQGDGDGDGIVDAREDALLERFAPKVWLHHEENRWPVNVEWLLRRSTLRYSHARCSDHEIIRWRGVTSINITEQVHRNARDPLTSWPWDACEHHGADNRSDRYTASPKNSFFLQFTDSSHAGSTIPRDWVIYGHVYPVANGIVIQYWQLYAYNDSFASANHEGDWEFTAVLTDRNEVPQRVVYCRHGHARDVSADRVEWEGDHHVTYVAKGGHAQYRAFETDSLDFPGSCDADSAVDETQGFADKCGQGTAWNT